MKYPAAVWVENGIYSAEIPDLPGVITEADSIEDLEMMLREDALGWLECELDDGRAIPAPTSIENYMFDATYESCTWLLVDIDVSKLSEKI